MSYLCIWFIIYEDFYFRSCVVLVLVAYLLVCIQVKRSEWKIESKTRLKRSIRFVKKERKREIKGRKGNKERKEKRK